MNIDPGFIPESQLQSKAESLLKELHPSGSIPIPIDLMIEKAKIDVIPVYHLKKTGHEAYTSRDRQSIYIDQGVLMGQSPNRQRFTLAHEFAHIVLHPKVFEAAKYTSIEEWMEFLESIPDATLKRIESQAYCCAGHLLVPENHLKTAYEACAQQLKENGLDIKSLPGPALLRVAKALGDQFQVSSDVIHRRAVADGYWKWQDMPPRS